MHVAVRRTIASVGSTILGSSRSSTLTSPGAYMTTPRISVLLASLAHVDPTVSAPVPGGARSTPQALRPRSRSDPRGRWGRTRVAPMPDRADPLPVDQRSKLRALSGLVALALLGSVGCRSDDRHADAGAAPSAACRRLRAALADSKDEAEGRRFLQECVGPT